jgi:hypothetical protein
MMRWLLLLLRVTAGLLPKLRSRDVGRHARLAAPRTISSGVPVSKIHRYPTPTTTDPSKLYVGHLDSSVTDAVLAKAFSTYGVVLQAEVCTDSNTGLRFVCVCVCVCVCDCGCSSFFVLIVRVVIALT